MSKRITNVKKTASAKKIIAIVAALLATVLVVGLVTVYSLSESGFFHRTKVAMKSDNYTVSSAMMNYYYNTIYQNYSSTYSQLGLDLTKDLKTQAYPGGGTWFDFFMDMTKSNVRQLLVLCEAAKAEGFKLADDKSHDHSADAVLSEIESMAKLYGTTLNYYLENTYGKGVNESVFRKCYELSEIASHYSEKMTGSYTFGEADFEKYYSENKDTFNKVDYLAYTFDVDNYNLPKEATEDEKKAIATRLNTYATEMLAVKTEEEFNTLLETYLNTDLYKDLTDEQKTEKKIDVKAEIEDCLTEGAKNSSTSELNKWLFDAATEAYATKLIKAEDGMSFTVAMILPAENTDLDDDCLYRDTYKLKDFRYIPFTNSSFKDNAKDANDAAVAALNTFKDDPTEEKFAKMADEYATTSYAGGLVEGVDKGAIGDEVDAWLYDSARKKGDCEVVEVADKGSFLIYYLGDGDVAWQATAKTELINTQYETDYAALEAKYGVKVMQAGLDFIGEPIKTNTAN